MGRNGRHGAPQTHRNPICSGGEEVLYILKGSKAQPHAGAVNNAVHTLVKVPALPEEQEKQHQFGRLFRNGRPKESRPESIPERMDFLGEKADIHERNRYEQRSKNRSPAIEEGLHQVPRGLPLQFILLINIIEENECRQDGQTNH